MDKNNGGFFNNKWVLRITSLILALFLFFYVNNSSKNGFLRQNTRNHNQTSALMSNKTATIKMPLDITSNDNYVVTGYPKSVKVKVTGPSALVTTTMNTQNFKAYIDLTKVGVGEHRVPVKTSGLNSELSASVRPRYVKVNVQPRKTITMKVNVRLSSRDLKNGYTVGDPKTDISTVQVTGSRSQVNRVARVVAYVAMPSKATGDIHRQVTLQALDKNGQTLNVVIEPATTNVTIPINSSSDNQSSSSSSNNEKSSSSSESADVNSSSTSESSDSDNQ